MWMSRMSRGFVVLAWSRMIINSSYSSQTRNGCTQPKPWPLNPESIVLEVPVPFLYRWTLGPLVGWLD